MADAIPYSTPEANAYADRAVALGAGIVPTATLAWGTHPRQTVEIFGPSRHAGRLPVLSFYHGGGWVAGSTQWLRFMAPAVLQSGAIFVAGSYRVAPEHRWPLPYLDVCKSLDFVDRRIAGFGGDPRRHIVGGHSAGGHLAALAVLREDIPPVRACFPVSSAYTLQYGDVPIDSPEGRVYKYLFSNRQQDFKASPITFVAGKHPPLHLVWGEHDFARIARTSREMVVALKEAQVAVTSEVVAGADHFETHLRLNDPACPWYDRLREGFGDAA